ncbi:GT4 family glycosyltransferase PelF [Castellaniella sp. FW104-16D08]|uniref:GT4 family glycosyltransferase PelF n=1 Tax=unclassified Castellaniella TaxID=2617606 RepID=UPI0033149BB1
MTPVVAKEASRADIALLLEGTFPYVAGGVSSWVADLLRAHPQYTFAILFIGGRKQDYGPPRYPLPENVVWFREVFIFDESARMPVREARSCPVDAMQSIQAFHDGFYRDKQPVDAPTLKDILPLISSGGPVTEKLFLHGQQSWEEIRKRYLENCTDPSFTDYFWTVRIMHIPLWKLIRAVEDMIPVSMCHAVSTGYAGFFGALMQACRKTPLLLSEHGIYTKERQIDLFQSAWIRDNRSLLERNVVQIPYFQALWMRFFRTLGTMAYDAASVVSALFEENRRRQVQDGAAPEKTQVIPNGIEIDRYLALRQQRPIEIPPVLALIGRVVPIKDIRTFIRAVFIAARTQPDVQGWIVGPEDEDPDYVEECRSLVATLELQDRVHFLGFRDVREILPLVGLVVLSSISEGLPLVILEAYAAGVPVVSTDVGACRELIEGSGPEDRALGVSGHVVQLADPSGLAQACLGLLSSPDSWRAARVAGIARVERYYSRRQMINTYDQLYKHLLAGAAEGHVAKGAIWPE